MNYLWRQNASLPIAFGRLGALPTCYVSPLIKNKFIHLGLTSPASYINGSIIKNAIKKIGTSNRLLKYRMLNNSNLIYENVVDTLNYDLFFKEFNMPDTFNSWFLITELHIWMIMCRYMAEGKNGQYIRNAIVQKMWTDLKNRVDKLGTITSSKKNKQIMQIGEQFQAAIIGYDEAILSNDMVLAGALWRRFFLSECNNPQHIEMLVLYVRKQMQMLDKIPPDEILDQRSVNWLPLEKIK
ncbi:ubiquinol-cytochrome-c reductase complex assembly factor 1 [Prorops nasuta]|uniref:ubiquinol-cytochrome-c reductase complex assembly factor 1 n=1 Tax=Prorops nasuta TaxID=863751 RepID=UPI0034CD2E80